MSFFRKILSKDKNGLNVFNEFSSDEDLTIIVKNIRHGAANPKYFYADTNNQLSKIYKNWVFEPADMIFRCGYDYEMNVIKEEKIVSTVRMCFMCNRLTIRDEVNSKDSKIFMISQKEIEKLLKKDFKPMTVKHWEFENADQAFAFWNKEKDNPNLIKFNGMHPRWFHQNGLFAMDFKYEFFYKNE